MPDKNTNALHFKTSVGYIISKYVHYDMRCLVKNIKALLYLLDGFGIAVLVCSY